MAESGASSTPEMSEQALRRLIRKSRLWSIVTVVMVVIISPFSFLIGLLFGIAPDTWLGVWLHWVVVFIVLAMIIALLGLEAASSCWLKAERVRKQLREGTRGDGTVVEP